MFNVSIRPSTSCGLLWEVDNGAHDLFLESYHEQGTKWIAGRAGAVLADGVGDLAHSSAKHGPPLEGVAAELLLDVPERAQLVSSTVQDEIKALNVFMKREIETGNGKSVDATRGHGFVLKGDIALGE